MLDTQAERSQQARRDLEAGRGMLQQISSNVKCAKACSVRGGSCCGLFHAAFWRAVCHGPGRGQPGSLPSPVAACSSPPSGAGCDPGLSGP